MARDGAGTYNLPQPPFVSGTVISSTATNSNNSDIAAALTQSIARDGQTVPTANLPMGTYRHTGVGNAVARTDYAAMGQVQDGAGIWCGTAGGTANALTLTPSPAITAYAAGQMFRFTAGAAANTGATTVAVSGLTAQAIQNAGAALTGGEIAANRQYSVLYDGAAFQLQNFAPTAIPANSISLDKLARVGTAGQVLTSNGAGADASYQSLNIAARSGVKGQTGQNNSGTPNTQYDFAADEVVLTNGAGGLVLRTATGTVTNNVLTAGPAANGRDQAGAFTAASFIHFWWIWNGTTLATLSSASATAPTLPSGYTHRAYIGAVYFNGSSQLVTTRIRGATVFYAARQSALNAGTANTETTVSLSALMPSNALGVLLSAQLFVPASVNNNATADLRFVSGNVFHQLQAFAVAGTTNGYDTAQVTGPNVSQQVFYINSSTSAQTSIWVNGYTVPNGDS